MQKVQKDEEKRKYDYKNLSQSICICKLLMWLINEKI